MKRTMAAVLLAALAVPVLAQTAASDAALTEGTVQYKTTISLMGQQLVIPSTRTLTKITKDGRALWRVVDVAALPAEAGGGTAVDTFEVLAATLMPVRRSGGSAGGTVVFDYDGASVKGTVASMMGAMSVDSTFSEPIVGDGAAFELLLAGLPLAAGFEQTFMTYSPQMQATRPVRIEVTGEDTLTTPAGEFAVYVVDFTPQDDNPAGKSTLYLMKAAPHITVRAESDLGPQMGGAVAVTELQKQ